MRVDWAAGGWSIAGKTFWDGSASHRGRPLKSRLAASRRAARFFCASAATFSRVAVTFSLAAGNFRPSAQISVGLVRDLQPDNRHAHLPGKSASAEMEFET